MKLLEIGKRGSGYCVTLQLTTNELVSTIAMYEVVAEAWRPGLTQEKRTKSKLIDIFDVVEKVIAAREEFRQNPTDGVAYYEYREGQEMDPVQRFIEERTRGRL